MSNLEFITLEIGDVEFIKSMVTFEYEPALQAEEYSPPEPEWLEIYKVELAIQTSIGEVWATMHDNQHHLIEKQVMEYIREQAEDRALERAIDELERQQREDY